MNSAKNYVGPALARQRPNFVAAQCIGGMNADAHGIACLNALGIQRAKGFIDQNRVAKSCRSGASQYVLPPRSNNRRPERYVARVDQMNVHAQYSFYCGLLRTVSRVTSGTRIYLQCVLGETLDLLAPNGVASQFSALCLAGSGGRRLRRVCDSEVVEGSLGLKGEEVKFGTKMALPACASNHVGADEDICP